MLVVVVVEEAVVVEAVVESVVLVNVVGDIVDVVVLGKTENITTDDYLKKIHVAEEKANKLNLDETDFNNETFLLIAQGHS